MLLLKNRVIAALFGVVATVVATVVVTPGVASAAAFSSVELEICNQQTGTEGAALIYITGLNQNGNKVDSLSAFVDLGQCKVWRQIGSEIDKHDYWWKKGQTVTVHNSVTVRGGDGWYHNEERDSAWSIPPDAPDGWYQGITLR